MAGKSPAVKDSSEKTKVVPMANIMEAAESLDEVRKENKK